jgi:hypothetical protein
MIRRHASSVQVGEVIHEYELELVLEEQISWDGGVCLTILDLITGEKRYNFFAPFDEIEVLF